MNPSLPLPQVTLRPNGRFLAPHAVVERRRGRGPTSFPGGAREDPRGDQGFASSSLRVIGHEPSCHYHGFVRNHSDSRVAISACRGLVSTWAEAVGLGRCGGVLRGRPAGAAALGSPNGGEESDKDILSHCNRCYYSYCCCWCCFVVVVVVMLLLLLFSSLS